jgi:hypothetical protein
VRRRWRRGDGRARGGRRGRPGFGPLTPRAERRLIAVGGAGAHAELGREAFGVGGDGRAREDALEERERLGGVPGGGALAREAEQRAPWRAS